MDHSQLGHRMARLTRVVVLLLLAGMSANAQTSHALRNLAYGGEPLQRLDLYLPASRHFASVLFLHGGSLSGGDKEDDDYRGICQPVADSGVACASMNYRLFPAVKWPVPEQDAATAFAWMKSHISEYGGDPARVYLFGHSSGCLLASLLGTDPSFLAAHALKLSDIAGVVAMGCRLNGVVDASGATPEQIRRHFARDPYDAAFGSIAALNDAVPAAHVSAGMPPFLILIAEAEQENPPLLADAKEFVARAEKAGARAKYMILPGLTHYSAIHNARSAGDPTLRRILQFVSNP